LHKASADECENITGALVTSSASIMVWTDTCDRSTIIPRRFISRITSWKSDAVGQKIILPYYFHAVSKSVNHTVISPAY
jgi:hypothetical protein